MSITHRVIGIRNPDEQWKRMKAVFDACTAAKCEIPSEVSYFFNDEPPDPKGVILDLDEEDCCFEYHDDNYDGFEIDLQLLPANLTKIRLTWG